MGASVQLSEAPSSKLRRVRKKDISDSAAWPVPKEIITPAKPHLN